MTSIVSALICFVGLLVVVVHGGIVPIPGFRPPSVPLIVNDPYFSVWAASDNLTDTWSQLWDGTTKAFAGIIRIDNTPYRFMGPTGGIPVDQPMQQISVTVYPTNTVYVFQAGGIELTVTFTTPLLPWSLDLLSRPVTYLTFSAASYDGKAHDVQIYYDNTAEIAVNTVTENVIWGQNKTEGGLLDMFIGTSAQPLLQNPGDAVGIDWGYFHVATASDDTSMSFSMNAANTTRSSFASSGTLPSSVFNGPIPCDQNWPVLAIAFNLGSVDSSPVQKVLLLAYDDIYSLNFFGTMMKSYWHQLFTSILSLLDQAWTDYKMIISETQTFDTNVLTKMQQIGGDEYATLTALAYRQCVGGTKMTWNPEKNSPWYFMKEISSDGDISTVDVIFPASPLFLYFNATLLGLQLLPVFAYANNETSNPYSLVWAPHHLGTWPVADILTSQQENMPIEETANMILMVAAVSKYSTFDVIIKTPAYWALLEQWGNYLVSALPDPGNQLCTDDFEGPTPHDANLAVKGILGVAAFAQLNALVGNQTAAKHYYTIAANYVQDWIILANPNNTDHYRLRYDLPGWSLKYNMVFQNILDMWVFPDSVMEMELNYYMEHLHPYGIPLDVRSDYSKLDWQSWIAAQATNPADWYLIINGIYQFAQETPQRVPLTDWYYTSTPNQQGFRARTVVGGLWAKAVFA
eukprot:Phypoly_transcript_04418.p1 GENE.Phypoly_transcript_04418~~Phypoly_transcript_04418.p1  ORF type:complete len:712 (+),score=112.47 Phypoly_transcript_04418:73-2136(+)